ncbi:hypothetical protein EVAR_5484_1 [Eumeta japonica]|uniref:Uncharacterized protein n=1 Tax=Eumeta variegata TaxID=151549 RepID=A0A4C1TBE7_EUMVA|nr:hypothetical protein EVAR_5484_1 [Eumeta japonica]
MAVQFKRSRERVTAEIKRMKYAPQMPRQALWSNGWTIMRNNSYPSAPGPPQHRRDSRTRPFTYELVSGWLAAAMSIRLSGKHKDHVVHGRLHVYADFTEWEFENKLREGGSGYRALGATLRNPYPALLSSVPNHNLAAHQCNSVAIRYGQAGKAVCGSKRASNDARRRAAR